MKAQPVLSVWLYWPDRHLGSRSWCWKLQICGGAGHTNARISWPWQFWPDGRTIYVGRHCQTRTTAGSWNYQRSRWAVGITRKASNVPLASPYAPLCVEARK